MSFGDQPWVYVCKGKKRSGESKVVSENGLHHWQRRSDRTAYCLRCGMELTVEQADECFTQR
jgi:hypothetical protein